MGITGLPTSAAAPLSPVFSGNPCCSFDGGLLAGEGPLRGWHLPEVPGRQQAPQESHLLYRGGSHCWGTGWRGGTRAAASHVAQGALGVQGPLLALLPLLASRSPCRGCVCPAGRWLGSWRACPLGSTHRACVGRDPEAIAGNCSAPALPGCGRAFGLCGLVNLATR